MQACDSPKPQACIPTVQDRGKTMRKSRSLRKFPAQEATPLRSSSAQHRGPGAERGLNPPFLLTPTPLA